MSSKKKNLALAFAVAAAVAAPSAFATNGYFVEGMGTINRGMAGAGGAALPQDTFTAASNPAGLVNVGQRLDLALGIFRPVRHAEVTGSPLFDTSQSGNEDAYFFIPSFGYNWKLDNDNAVALAVYGQGGMNTKYKNSIFGTGDMGIDLSQLFVNGSYAHRFGPVSLGASAIYAYQRFKAFGLQDFDNSFFSSDPGHVTNNGYDTTGGLGGQVGVLWDVTNEVSLGAYYHSKIKGKFNKYSGLFAEGGEFDIPSTYGIGAGWKVNPTVDIAFDYAKIKYTDSKSVSNPTENLFAGNQFGSSDGPGFGWKDINVYKLGAQFHADGGWTYRVGWNHGDNPIPTSESFINILAPGLVTDHLNLGFTKAIDKTSDFSMMYMHAFKKDQTGDIPLALGGGQAKISMYEDYIEFGYSAKF